MSDDGLDRLKDNLADRYSIEEEIGRGGMAVVYRAEDLKHGRKVAVKVLQGALASTIGTERFLREIEVVAKLQHPHVLTLIDSGEADGLPWYVMPYVEGRSLKEHLEREGPLPVGEAVEIAREIADALEVAHGRGVIHRDVKPGNVLLSGGHAVVADFGIAAALDEAARGDLTATGVSLGSPVYMSPEQATGDGDVDARSDVYALGCVLYEMLAGRPPFDGPLQSLVTRKVMGTYQPLDEARPDVPPTVARAVRRAMEVEPADRFASAAEFREALAAASAEPGEGRGGRRALVAAAAVGLIVVVALVAIRSVQAANERERWVAEQLDRVERLAGEGRYDEALAVAEEVEDVAPGDTTLARLLPEISFTIPIRTDPPGAEVLIQPLDAPEGQWERLGTTPLDGVRIAGVIFGHGDGSESYLHYQPARLRFTLDGHRPRELLLPALLGSFVGDPGPLDPVELLPEASAAEGMVQIPGFTVNGVAYDDFFLGRHEVTNADFARFVEAGGYRSPEHWKHPFVVDGRELSFEQAMERFEDPTGRPGPSAWRLGTFPEGEEDFPVRGVSWHEAAAYADWAGGELPTEAHHARGAPYLFEASHAVVPRSNLGGDGPRPVGANRAMTVLGVYDLLGNVREWIYNPAGPGLRATRGGAWTDPPFAAFWTVPTPAFERGPTFGFRIARTPEDDEALVALRAPVGRTSVRDYRTEEPASAAEYAIFERLYDYDPVALEPVVERVDTTDHWIREIVTYERPYGDRGMVALYLPRSGTAPFKPVLYWGGSGGKAMTSVDEEFTRAFDFIVRSGRAVAVPILAGTYGRPLGGRGAESGGRVPPRGSVAHRDLFIEWVKDFRTTLDYLETRDDVDTGTAGFFGLSWGGVTAPVVLAVEPRIDAAVLNVGGLSGADYQPEVDPFNFTPRVRTPLLMISGRHDPDHPYETSQLPLFESLGTPPEDKRHHLSEAAHLVPQDEVIRETLDWYDRYLGPAGG